MDKNLKKYVDDFFNSIPRVEMSEIERKEFQKRNLKEDIEYYRNRDEKGYSIW